MPNYMEEFVCTGTSCEENCCMNRWVIHVDKVTYTKYQNLKHSAFKPMLNRYIVRDGSNSKEETYAKIEFDDRHQCVFLNDSQLCSIQKSLGIGFLPTVCWQYPRYYNIVDGTYEISAAVSCPEVARLALLKPGGITFLEKEQHISNKVMVQYALATGSSDVQDINRYFWQLRTFTMQILKCQDYLLWERLIILGLFYKRISQLVQDSKASEISEVINDYTKQVVAGAFAENLAHIPSQPELQVIILTALVDARVKMGIENKSYLDCYDKFLAGLGFAALGHEVADALVDKYQENYRNYFQPFMQPREYILENYLVNYVFKNLFPLQEWDVFDSYISLIMHYTLIKAHLIGMAGFYKETLSEQEIIKLMYSFGRVVEQSPTYLAYVTEVVKVNKLDSLAYMAILIKN